MSECSLNLTNYRSSIYQTCPECQLEWLWSSVGFTQLQQNLRGKLYYILYKMATFSLMKNQIFLKKKKTSWKITWKKIVIHTNMQQCNHSVVLSIIDKEKNIFQKKSTLSTQMFYHQRLYYMYGCYDKTFYK